MLYHAVNVILAEVELFVIRSEINQAVQMQDVSCTIVITDAIHAVEKIFDPSMHLHQQQSIAISKELRAFFSKHTDDTIEFLDYSNDE